MNLTLTLLYQRIMYFIKSDLVKNIQNTFKQANIEIFSTQYIDIREFKKEEKANSKENKR